MKKYYFLALVFFAVNTSASGYLSTGNNTSISWINIEPAVIRIAFSDSEKLNPDNCDSLGAVLMTNETEYDKAIYSTLLAAMLSGKKVRLYGSGCLAGWGTTYPKLKAVYVYN
ncbi:hypothetical protein P886_2348 [Alteromonadaceae bacterium 2753L.S.0a.02]|nr:hypothetical protein P886_2348 [Alteromonadaceae bacterium 2753L.S.0a.02]